jgi:hypothetical protein
MTSGDLLVWQRNLGTIAPWAATAIANVASVPEPAAASLAALLAAAGLASPIRRRLAAC